MVGSWIVRGIDQGNMGKAQMSGWRAYSADPSQLGGLGQGEHAILPGSASRAPLSLGMVFLLLFTMIVIGRVTEAFPGLESLRLGLVTGGIGLFLWMFSRSSIGEKLPTEIPQVKYVLLLLGLAVVTIPTGIWPGGSFMIVTGGYIKTVLFFVLVIYWCRSLQDVRRMIWACCLGLTAQVVYGLLAGQMVGGRFHAASSTYDPNDLALVLAMFLPLMIYLLSSSGPIAKLVVVGMVATFLYGFILAQSRGGFLALLVIGCLIIFRSRLSRPSKLFLVGITLVVFGALAGSSFWDRIETIWDPKTEYDRTAGGRTWIWKTGLTIMATQPWGVGAGSFVIAEGMSHGGEGKFEAAHNTFLQVGVELGVMGLAVFLLLFVRSLKDLSRIQAGLTSWGKDAGVVALASALEVGIWGFLVGSLFLETAYSPSTYLMVALTVVCARLGRPSVSS